MKKKSLSFVSASLVAIGGVIGAGFASGREIYTFFRGEKRGILVGAAVFAIMFVFSLAVYFFGRENDVDSMNTFSESLSKKGSPIITSAYMFCFYVVIAAMLSGIDELFSFSGVSFPIFSIASFFICAAFFVNGIKGIERANFVLTPVLIILLVVITSGFCGEKSAAENPDVVVTGVNGLMYVSMNFCLSSVVMAESGKSMTKRQAVFAALLTSAVIGILVGLFIEALSKGDFADVAIPITSMTNGRVLWIFAIITLYFSIITTLLASCLPVYSFWQSRQKGKILPLALVFAPSFLLSRFGFIKILSSFYPIQSVVGMIALVLMLSKLKRPRVSTV